MRRPSRELVVFSVSAIDLFASAMGSFILIAIVLFPYYLNTTTAQEAESLAAEAATLGERVEELEAALAAAEAEADASKAALDDALARVEALEDALADAEARAQAAEARAAAAEREAADASANQPGGPMTLPSIGGSSTAFAMGCWRTEPFRHSPAHAPGVSQYCFDANGNGNLIFERRQQGEICAAYARIRRNGEQIQISDSDSRCNRGQQDIGPWYADHLACTPNADGVVLCQGRSQNWTWTVRLFRQ